mmetsp:Transcript_11225/g.27596  ORF Transcript_11225/g.27596 Transcript_11225/m.27596 type:complete len:268 (-) Transcript_11225:46-849(-)
MTSLHAPWLEMGVHWDKLLRSHSSLTLNVGYRKRKINPLSIGGARRSLLLAETYHHLKQGFSSNKVMVDHAANGQHGKSSVLDLLKLQLIHLVLALALEAILGESQVSRDPIGILEHVLHRDLAVIGTPFLGSGDGDYLHHGGNSHGRRGHVGIVDVDGLEHWEANELTGDETDGCEHGHATVLDFGLLEPLGIPHVGPSQRIEAYGSDEAVGFGRVDQKGETFGHFSIEGDAGFGYGGRGEGGGRAQEGGDGGNLHHGRKETLGGR